MVEDTNWREGHLRVRARRCCKDVQCAADAAGIFASPIAPRAASKRPGMCATAHMVISVIGTANP